MPAKLVADVESLGINPQQPFHSRHQIGLWRFEDQMKMVAHQAIGPDPPIRLGGDLAQSGQKQLTVLVVLEYVLPPVAAIHHMINRTRIFHSQLARHPATLSKIPRCVNSED